MGWIQFRQTPAMRRNLRCRSWLAAGGVGQERGLQVTRFLPSQQGQAREAMHLLGPAGARCEGESLGGGGG
jgi:hypothetical protein